MTIHCVVQIDRASKIYAVWLSERLGELVRIARDIDAYLAKLETH